MSWFDRVKATLTGKRASGDRGGAPSREPSGRRDIERAVKRDPAIAKLSREIAALPDGPKKLGLYFERGVAYKELGDLDSALADLARVVEVAPALPDVHVQRAECLLLRADYAPAIDSLDRAIALLPVGAPLAMAHANRGTARAALGEFEGALADFTRAAKLAPEMASALREDQARIEQQRERGGPEPSAEATSKQARSAAGSVIEQGWELDARGDLVGALVAFGRAIEETPSPAAYYARGVVHCKLGRSPQAIADLDRALELRPHFAAALTERGLAYAESGEAPKALEDYDAAIALDPAYGIAHENKGLALLQEQRWAEAIPCLDVALRITPRKASIRYHRGLAHEMLGDLSRALRDLQDSVRLEPKGEHARHAESRLRTLRARARDVPAPEFPAPEDLWPVLTGIGLEDTVATLVQRVHAEGAYFGQIELPDGSATYAQFYGKHGLRERLTEIADVIGPRILTLALRQFHDLLHDPPSGPPPAGADHSDRSAAPGDVEHLIEGSRIDVLKHGERLLGVFSHGIPHDDLDLPTVLFGPRPIFGRSDRSDDAAGDARRCAACRRAVAYFDAVLEADKLTGYACTHCGASPIPTWIEQRMRPGRWSRSGFLGPTEGLADIIARDDQTLARLGVGHAQIADALDRLLTSAFRASTDRIAQASARFEAEMRASGMRGLPGLAMLPLGASLDELVEQLRTGGQLPAERGTAVDDHDVFLQLYAGYQYCPFTLLRLPWSDDAPARRLIRRQTAGVAYVTEPIDRELPCRSELSYRHANLEFLIVGRDTRQSLRGSGLLVHLIRDHRCFEGEHSPFRLDPEQAARVLGLI